MITRVSIQGFKAIRKSTLALPNLAVFVGNNGSGKSSVIEALQTLQNILQHGLSEGFGRWYGLEKIQNNQSSDRSMRIGIRGKLGKTSYEYEVEFGYTENADEYFVRQEVLKEGKNTVWDKTEKASFLALKTDLHPFAQEMSKYILSWQFLSLEPEKMYFPTARNQSGKTKMESSGSNVADIFSRLQDQPQKITAIIEKMRYVLPDLADFSAHHDKIRKEVFLEMQEQADSKKSLPSWLFSSGTLRVLALLTLLNHAEIPPVIFIEEIENGLDPRTLNMLVDELQRLLPRHQFVITTHSPYFLDLLELEHLIVAERTKQETHYFRPADDEKLLAWKEKFSVGKLYTMNKLVSK